MKKVLIIITFLFFVIDSYSQGTKFFKGTWAEVLEQAKKEDKLIFVDVSTTWCHPCKKMKKEILPQKKVGDFFNKNFINLSINAYNLDGLEFALFYKVNSFPTFFFIDKRGNVINKFFGFKMANQLIKLGKQTLNYYNKAEEYKQGYIGGKRNYAFIIKYIQSLNRLDKPSEYLAKEFLASNKLREALKLKFIYRTINSTQGELFKQLIDNIDKIKTLFKPDEVEDKVYTLFKKDIEKHVYSGKRKIVKNILKLIKTIEFLSYGEFKIYSKLIRAKAKGNYKKFKKYAEKYFYAQKNDKRKREFIKELYLTKVKGKDIHDIVFDLADKLNNNSKSFENKVFFVKVGVLTKHFVEAEKQIKMIYRSTDKKSNKKRFSLKRYNNYLIKNKSNNVSAGIR